MEHQDRLTKPPGALGRLEAPRGAAGRHRRRHAAAPCPRPAAVAVFAGDHGVLAQGVTPWPKEVTAQMVANFLAGGAAINVLAAPAGASVTVVDVGVGADLAPVAPGCAQHKVAPGTADLAVEPAHDDGRGAGRPRRRRRRGRRPRRRRGPLPRHRRHGHRQHDALRGRHRRPDRAHPAAAVTGRGTGIDDATLARKVGRRRGRPRPRCSARCRRRSTCSPRSAGWRSPPSPASSSGGRRRPRAGRRRRRHRAGRRVHRRPRWRPDALGYCVAGHRSTEPGASAALEHLGLEPLLDLGLRLGEGTGACLAVPLLVAAAPRARRDGHLRRRRRHREDLRRTDASYQP